MKTPCIFAALAFAGLAFTGLSSAQTKTITVEPGQYSEGTITDFEPTSSIVIRTAPDVDPVNYQIREEISYVNEFGKPVKMSSVIPGTVVKVDYEEIDGKMYARKVIVPGSPATVAARQEPAEVRTRIVGTRTGVVAKEVTTTTTHLPGYITSYEPQKRLVVRTEKFPDPITYRMTDDTVFVTPRNEVIKVREIHPGAPVTVYYDDVDDYRVVNRVVVDDDYLEEYAEELEERAEDVEDALDD